MQDHLKQMTQEYIQVNFGYLQRGTLHDLPGHAVPPSEVLPHVDEEFLVGFFLVITPCPVTGHH